MNKKDDLFDFENLKVYQKALDTLDKVYDVADNFPPSEIYNLTSQLKRAITSVSLNIGEGSGGSRKEFIQFLVITKRSIRECIICTTIAYRRKYINEKTKNELRSLLTETSKMNSGLINYLESDKAKEIMSEPSEYYLTSPN